MKLIDFNDVPAPLQPAVAQVRHLLGCYLRYFVGRPRGAADLLLFHEIVQRLEVLERQLQDHAPLREAVGLRLGLLRKELTECEDAHKRPTPAADKVGLLAARANQQFAFYTRLFAARARLSRRPLLAERLIRNLTAILDEMRALDVAELPTADEHLRNIDLVTRELERLREEAEAISKERQETIRDELIRQLGSDANLELVEGRKQIEGKDRQLVDLEGLAGICDRLGELTYQMATVAEETDDSINLANLRLASRTLAKYEAEYVEISELRKTFISIATLVASEHALRSQLQLVDAPEEARKLALERLDALLADPVVRKLAAEPMIN